MKHPTIEQIKERYKNAKKVRCLNDSLIYYISNEFYNDVDNVWCDYDFNDVHIYDAKLNKYAEIVEYKEDLTQNVGNYNEQLNTNKMSNKINVEVTTKEQRDELIKQLQEMEFEEKLPESWEDLKEVKGFCIDESSSIYHSHRRAVGDHKNIFSSNKQARSALAYAQLTQLLKAYNGDWTPDWNNDKQFKYNIEYFGDELRVNSFKYSQNFLSLETHEKAEHFLKHHKELIKQFYMIN